MENNNEVLITTFYHAFSWSYREYAQDTASPSKLNYIRGQLSQEADPHTGTGAVEQEESPPTCHGTEDRIKGMCSTMREI